MSVATVKKYKRDKGAVGYKETMKKPVYTDSGWNKWWEVTKGFENNKKLNNFWVKPSSVKIAQQVGIRDLIRLILVDNGIIDAIWIPEESDYDNNYFYQKIWNCKYYFPDLFYNRKMVVKPTIFGKSYQETGYMVSKKNIENPNILNIDIQTFSAILGQECVISKNEDISKIYTIRYAIVFELSDTFINEYSDSWFNYNGNALLPKYEIINTICPLTKQGVEDSLNRQLKYIRGNLGSNDYSKNIVKSVNLISREYIPPTHLFNKLIINSSNDKNPFTQKEYEAFEDYLGEINMTSFVKSLTYDKDLKHPFIKGLVASLVAIAEKENFKLYEKSGDPDKAKVDTENSSCNFKYRTDLSEISNKLKTIFNPDEKTQAEKNQADKTGNDPRNPLNRFVVNNGKEPTGAVNYYNMIGNSADGAAKPTPRPTPPSTPTPTSRLTHPYNPNATPNPERTGYGNIAGFGTEPIIEILPV
jgi:hypothetical protein